MIFYMKRTFEVENYHGFQRLTAICEGFLLRICLTHTLLSASNFRERFYHLKFLFQPKVVSLETSLLKIMALLSCTRAYLECDDLMSARWSERWKDSHVVIMVFTLSGKGSAEIDIDTGTLNEEF